MSAAGTRKMDLHGVGWLQTPTVGQLPTSSGLAKVTRRGMNGR